MSHFDYMVDSIKGAYFDVLVDKLYKVLNFVNIPKEEVRPIDIKEKLNSMGWCDEETTARYYYKSYYAQNNKSIILVGLSSITDYLNLMVKYLKSPKCACVANSRAELFKDYAVGIIENKQYLDKNSNKIDMDQDYSKVVDIKKFKDRNPNKRNRKKFSNEQIAEIMAVDNTDIAKTVLMLIYSGLRISEFLNLKKVNCHLEDRYINVVASKTDNGIRKVPIADKTIDYWRYFYDKPDSEYLVSMDGRDFSKAKGQTAYRNTYWNPFMEALGFNKRDIHETRYTCISKLEDAEIYQAKINRIVGHTGKTVAENVYTQLDIQGLIEAINKI